MATPCVRMGNASNPSRVGPRPVLAACGRLPVGRPPPAEPLEVLREMRTEVGTGERRVDEGADVPGLVAGVVASSLELDRPDRKAFAGHLADGVGEPDLAAAAGLEPREDVEHLRLEHVAVDRRETAGRVLRFWLLDDR